MIFFVKRITILSLICTIEPIISHEGIKYPIEVEYFDGITLKYNTIEFNIPLYYNPVDEKWRIEKCVKLGFTHNKSMVGEMFISNMIPVDIFFNKFGIYELLSEYLCKNLKLSSQMQRNVLEKLNESEKILAFFRRRDWFDLYIKKYIIVEEERIQSQCGDVEMFAISEYLDVCIYLYRSENNDWTVFREKNWPNYDGVDMKDEECIYLYLNNDRIGIVSNVTGPY
ncbi:uncharacterized protein LOC126910284 [Daktulosphaira vitifoliae]|uniref:uncharacterized protein LOC126910284 n=1 Tax=Daktulosphaira vitifoliae TaxID=58002 RepID=UPI0021AA6F2E|nr:uncharacterized protein LOC126910284 [Daktulosphaira vitifoliae]